MLKWLQQGLVVLITFAASFVDRSRAAEIRNESGTSSFQEAVGVTTITQAQLATPVSTPMPSNTNLARVLRVRERRPVSAPNVLEPSPGTTNKMDGIERLLCEQALSYERRLTETNIAPQLREIYEKGLADCRRRIADHHTNAQLWAELFAARKTGDLKNILACEQKVADYLRGRLDKRLGTSCPPDSSLPVVIEDYNNRSEDHAPR